MCVNKEWRVFIDSAPNGVTVSGPSEEEFSIESEEVEVTNRMTQKIEEVQKKDKLVLDRQSSWFYPGPGKLQEFVLGWNHGVVIRLGEDGIWEVEYLFTDEADTYHKAFSSPDIKGASVKGIAATKGWKVIKFNKRLPVSRVTTYNATSCSIAVAFPRDTMNRLMISHVDGSYAIPIPAMIEWCQAQDAKVKTPCSEYVQPFCAIASICPGSSELLKFGKSAWVKSPKWDVETLLLTRSTLDGPETRPMENHTQFGLLLLPKSTPLFGGFIGWPQPSMIVTMTPIELLNIADKLYDRLGESWDEECEMIANEQIITPLLKNVYGHAGLHRFCIEELPVFYQKRGERKMTPCEAYIRGVQHIRGKWDESSLGEHKDLMALLSKIMMAFQRKLWMELSPDRFDYYRL